MASSQPESGQRVSQSRLFASVVTTAFGNLAGPISAFVTGIILARALGPEGRGLVAAAMAPNLLILAAATFGIPEAVTYYVAKGAARNRRTLGSAFAWTFLFGMLASAAAWVVAPAIVGSDPVAITAYRWAVVAAIPGLFIGVARAYAAGQQAWRTIALERLTSSLCRLAAIAVLSVVGALTVMSGALALAFGGLAGAFAYIRQLGSVPKADAVNGIRSGSLLKYGSAVWVGGISGVLLMRLDQFLLAPLAGATELGYYVVAVAVSEVPLFAVAALRDVVFSKHSERDDPQGLAQVARLSNLLGITCGALLLALTYPLILILFGVDFIPAVVPTLVLVVAVCLGPAGSIAGAGLAAGGRPGLRSVSLAVAAIFNIVLLVVLAPLLGATGAALATLAGNVISTSLNILMLARRSGIPARHYVIPRASDVRAVVTRRGTSRVQDRADR